MKASAILSAVALLSTAGVISGCATREVPFFEQQDLFVSGEGGIFQYRIPAMVTTTKGTLVVVCDGRVERTGDVPNNIDLVSRRSVDNGKTWEPMKRIVDFPGTEGACDASLLVDLQTGTLWLFYAYTDENVGLFNSQPGLAGPTMFYHARKSDDDGATWSAPRDLNPEVKDPKWSACWPGPGNGIQTESGRLLVPTSVYHEKRHSSWMISSDNHGETWSMLGVAGEDTNEPQVVELADSTLLMNMRSYHELNQRAVARSTDGGKTWTKLKHEPKLIDPICQASIISYDENILLFSNPPSTKRENLTVRASHDGGETWPVSRRIHTGPCAYSSMSMLQDGTIGLFYYRDGRRMTFARFNLAWLTETASPETRKPN